MKNSVILSLLFLLINCYTYKVPKTEEKQLPKNIAQNIVPEQRYMVVTEKKTYKIKALRWEQDSLVAEVGNMKKNEIKIHKNQIKEVRNRTFSRERSDALTLGSYT